MGLPLADYGLIGNQAACALISRHGSIDWCGLPDFDSPSHFSALLDDNLGGRFQIAPAGEFRSEQRYRSRTNVLETTFETRTGRAVLVDWMPMEGGEPSRRPIILRRIEPVDGQITWFAHCGPKFNYGADRATAERHRGGVLFRGVDPCDLAHLIANVPLQISPDGARATSEFPLDVGSYAEFSWGWGRHAPRSTSSSLQSTADFWRSRAHSCPETGTCPFAGPWHDAVTRSGLTLDLLTHAFTGALIEAPTTSLPDISGGGRNWDLRYTWLRKSALTLQALEGIGRGREASAFFDWLQDIILRDGAESLQPVYTLDGGRLLPERELTFLSGYEGSRPVRVGNQSARQFELDIYGQVLLTCARRFEASTQLPQGLWERLSEIAEYICQAWRRPDQGPWELRAKPQHFVSSKVYCWVAIDRACQIAEGTGAPIPARWLRERSNLHRAVCEQGFDTELQSFVQAFGGRVLDASVLAIPLVGFLPFDDVRVQSTLNAIDRELSEGALIHRYPRSEARPDSDGAHLLSSFWYVADLALSGRGDEAADRLAELCTYATPLGMFAEQVDPASSEPLGNFPSAAVHISLINAALYVAAARGRQLPGLLLGGGKPMAHPRVSRYG